MPESIYKYQLVNHCLVKLNILPYFLFASLEIFRPYHEVLVLVLHAYHFALCNDKLTSRFFSASLIFILQNNKFINIYEQSISIFSYTVTKFIHQNPPNSHHRCNIATLIKNIAYQKHSRNITKCTSPKTSRGNWIVPGCLQIAKKSKNRYLRVDK